MGVITDRRPPAQRRLCRAGDARGARRDRPNRPPSAAGVRLSGRPRWRAMPKASSTRWAPTTARGDECDDIDACPRLALSVRAAALPLVARNGAAVLCRSGQPADTIVSRDCLRAALELRLEDGSRSAASARRRQDVVLAAQALIDRGRPAPARKRQAEQQEFAVEARRRLRRCSCSPATCRSGMGRISICSREADCADLRRLALGGVVIRSMRWR